MDLKNGGRRMTDVICGCGAVAPIVLIDETEPDEDIRGEFYGVLLVRCEACHTITRVDENLQGLLDEAENTGRLAGEPAPLVSLEEAEKNKKKGVPVMATGKQDISYHLSKN